MDALKRSQGLQTFLAKGPGYWTEPESDEGYAMLPVERVELQSPLPRTAATVPPRQSPPSDGLRTFLAKPVDYFTNPDYI